MSPKTIRTYIDQYKEQGSYFDPEYKRKNPILAKFVKEFPFLNEEINLALKEVLISDSSWEDKLFVADLLYLYKPINPSLLHPMLNCAATLPDPSFNRIFLKPCLNSFGIPIVSKMLARKFAEGNMLKKIRISSLLYWIRPKYKGENDELIKAIAKQAVETTNIVELYFYQLNFSGLLKQGSQLPQNAEELFESIAGNAAYEDFVFNQLNWKRPE